MISKNNPFCCVSLFSTLSRGIGILIILLGIWGCDNTYRTLSLRRGVPNEFIVTTTDPLTIPPIYDLKPPRTVPSPTQVDQENNNDSTQTASDTLFDTEADQQEETSSIPVDQQEDTSSIPADQQEEISSIPADQQEETSSIPADQQEETSSIQNADSPSSQEPTSQELFSRGERNLLIQVGAERIQPNIRQVINEEARALIDAHQSWIDQLIFWENPSFPYPVIDPQQEAERIRQNTQQEQSNDTETTSDTVSNDTETTSDTVSNDTETTSDTVSNDTEIHLITYRTIQKYTT